MAIQTLPQTNGVNVDQLVGTNNAIKDNPDQAQFKFGATNSWSNGGHSRTIIKSLCGAGSEDSSRTALRLCAKDITGA